MHSLLGSYSFGIGFLAFYLKIYILKITLEWDDSIIILLSKIKHKIACLHLSNIAVTWKRAIEQKLKVALANRYNLIISCKQFFK